AVVFAGDICGENGKTLKCRELKLGGSCPESRAWWRQTLHHRRVMLYIGQKEIHMHEQGSGVYIHQVDNTTRATKGMHQRT
ncbi:hypothetical protein N7537_002194, partial [Penicillium hordei]